MHAFQAAVAAHWPLPQLAVELLLAVAADVKQLGEKQPWTVILVLPLLPLVLSKMANPINLGEKGEIGEE